MCTVTASKVFVTRAIQVLRSRCAMITGVSVYSTTEVNKLFLGTVMEAGRAKKPP